MDTFVELLVKCSERAGNIARAIRAEKELFSLLIEEKESIEKNNKFVKDFKTLADVLIQETIRHEISQIYPSLSDRINGEETNLFTNSSGECVTIKIGGCLELTAQNLTLILSGDSVAANLLAAEVHREIKIDGSLFSNFKNINIEEDFSIDNMGIWIDPIDATSEYIKGTYEPESNHREQEEVFSKGGLSCVTILIGAYELTSGRTILGIVNQPFWKYSPNNPLSWKGRYFWGLSLNSRNFCSYELNLKSGDTSPLRIMLSESESSYVRDNLKKKFEIIEAPGAGYKLLCVLIGTVSAYVLSKSSTHLWDTCGPHGIIKALGGNLHSYSESDKELTYSADCLVRKMEKFANIGGIIAFRNREVLDLITECLKLSTSTYSTL